MKAEFRQECLKKIKSLPKHNKRYRDHKLNNALQKLLQRLYLKKSVHHISILYYWPLPFEADIRTSVKLSKKKMQVYLPFMVGESFKMVPFRLPLHRKSFGILECGNTNKTINKIDIAIVPAIGVDADGRRIGFGKGMYDRFFPTLKNKPIIIFVQSDFCYSNQVICDDYDIQCDAVLTPKLWYAMNRIRDVKRDTLRRRNFHLKRHRRFSHF
jgi:5-formyltetrahydrofolate cyclo-ligase